MQGTRVFLKLARLKWSLGRAGATHQDVSNAQRRPDGRSEQKRTMQSRRRPPAAWHDLLRKSPEVWLMKISQWTPTLIACALASFCIPAVASAEGDALRSPAVPNDAS